MDSIQLFNQQSLFIQDCGPKGRGVITAVAIPTRTVIDISPILLFPSEEYSLHGQHTQLDHYTYRWQGGMALALGLGSMFNHSNKPNVGFQRDFNNKVIRYTTLREIEAGEELCISYGPNLWFPDMEVEQEEEQEQEQRSRKKGVGRTNGENGHAQATSPGTNDSGISDSEDETGELFLARMQFFESDDDGK
ncbi:hypothetical protein BGZ98_006786 [Dissophora globulifera]|nr:hypothetical protein BGZ98_006786 [Dissophora globulifera]